MKASQIHALPQHPSQWLFSVHAAMHDESLTPNMATRMNSIFCFSTAMSGGSHARGVRGLGSGGFAEFMEE